jgi:hypothetical protein
MSHHPLPPHIDNHSHQGDSISTITFGVGGGSVARSSFNPTQDEILRDLLKKVYEEKIRSHCKFISDMQLLTFQPTVPNHMSKIVLDSMGIGEEDTPENERKGLWSKLGYNLKRLINLHRNTLTCALRKVVIKGELISIYDMRKKYYQNPLLT